MDTPIEPCTSSTPAISVELCALCREPKTEPENLNCGHSFCRQCLDDLRSYRREQWARCCPLCRQPILVSEDQTDVENSTDTEQWLPNEEEAEEYWESEVYDELTLNYVYANEDLYFYYSDSEAENEHEPEAQEQAENNQDNQNQEA